MFSLFFLSFLDSMPSSQLTKHGAERPSELYEAPHPFMRRVPQGIRGPSRRLHLADRVNVRQQISRDHQREYVNGYKDRGADREHHEEPLRDVCGFIYLQLHHRYHGETWKKRRIG